MSRKNFGKLLLVVVVGLVLVPVLAACSLFGGELSAQSRNINSYSIAAVYEQSAHTLTGEYELSYINRADVPLREIKLHLYGNAFREGAKYPSVSKSNTSKAYPNGSSFGGIMVSNVRLNGETAVFNLDGADMNILRVELPSELYPDGRCTLTLRFTLELADVLHRLGYNDNTVNLGNWYPIACVYENGGFVTNPYYTNGDCFYSDIANYSIKLTVPSAYTVAATGEFTSTEVNGKTTTYGLEAKAVRDFAIVMSDKFEVAQQTVGKTTVKYYYYSDPDFQSNLKIAVESLQTFSDLFGQYPYSTMSVVKTGFLHGGMEYAGLIYISDALSQDYFREVIVHETAHQWWYGLVGNDAVANAWMDEGLTEYSTTLFFEKNPQYGINKTDRIMDTMKDYLIYTDIFKAITGQLNTSMNRPSYEYLTEADYVCMTYTKGELLFDNLRATIGDKDFFNGLKIYCQRNKFANAKPSDLIGAFESAARKDLEGFFNAWLEGKVLITDLYGHTGN